MVDIFKFHFITSAIQDLNLVITSVKYGYQENMRPNYLFKNYCFQRVSSQTRRQNISNLNPIFGLIHSFTGGNYDSNKKRTGIFTGPSSLVDNSIEISNVYISRREFEIPVILLVSLSKMVYQLNSSLGFKKPLKRQRSFRNYIISFYSKRITNPLVVYVFQIKFFIIHQI